MLHLTDIKKYERCPRAFWLSRRQKKEFVPFVNYNESMSELVKQLLMHYRRCMRKKCSSTPALSMKI